MSLSITDPMQNAVDEAVLTWPKVKAKVVFGHRGYMRSDTLFGFLASAGVAVKMSSISEAEELHARAGVAPFKARGAVMRTWPVLPLRSNSELEFALSALRNSYEDAGKRRKKKKKK